MIHGYSDWGSSFEHWKQALIARGYDANSIHIANYRSLTNEVSIRDLAEGFDRALRIRAGLGPDVSFDAIVHSTGMLVVRAWLAAYAGRRSRLKRLIGLAPATFGSPMAHKGRSWLGAIFKGNREWGPDFLEAGDLVLDGLELGSQFTWDLAGQDMIGEKPAFGPLADTPYVFIFAGAESYGGIAKLVKEPGADGVVRWAACPLNTRKISMDLTKEPSQERAILAPWSNVDIPLTLVKGKNHTTILTEPAPGLVDLIDQALQVNSAAGYDQWLGSARTFSQEAANSVDKWQQFVMHVVDERGDPIPDFHIQLMTREPEGDFVELEGFDLDVHAYKTDPSFRCFHVNLTRLEAQKPDNMWIRLIASSGTELVGYAGYGSQPAAKGVAEVDTAAQIELTDLLHDSQTKFFYPFTTTLVEIRLNREPLPLEGENKVCKF